MTSRVLKKLYSMVDFQAPSNLRMRQLVVRKFGHVIDVSVIRFETSGAILLLKLPIEHEFFRCF